MNRQSRISTVVPFSLREAPSFIERQLPVGRVSAEAYKERKGGAGQTLTALGSYWKGRKPLILVRGAVLGCLLPATDDALADLKVFLTLMGMNDEALIHRLDAISPGDIEPDWYRYNELVDTSGKKAWRRELSRQDRASLIAEWLATLPYDDRLQHCLRPEDLDEDVYLQDAWPEINAHLGTSAESLSELVDQLGIMRFGRRPRVADTFAGGGSIPFEAARVGCESSGSDLNPIACLLTWGAINVIGASEEHRVDITAAQKEVVASIDREISSLGIEFSERGNRAKSYLYCVEARCTKTGYLVPVAPSWVISRNQRVVAKLRPRPESMDYAIDIVSGASDDEMAAAEHGTLVDDVLVHPVNPSREGIAMSVIKGDYKTASGENANRLRRWSIDDVLPREGDRFQERLYCIQWLKGRCDESVGSVAQLDIGEGEDNGRSTFFAAPTAHDLDAERHVREFVQRNLAEWQRAGWLPSQGIEPGEKTSEPIRNRGWTHWHHLFTPRHLLFGALALKAIQSIDDTSVRGALLIAFCRTLNYMSRMTQWRVRKPSPKKPADQVNHVFYNQALNTFYNFGARASIDLYSALAKRFPTAAIHGDGRTNNRPAADVAVFHDIYVTDPPYADAVAYHEITEYFIAWANTLGSTAFPNFDWDSRRNEAIKGSNEKFRADMVAAYRAMTTHMPDNGIQVVMFTHQDAGVWADLASIMWAAGLRVSAAWNVVTETTSALKKGNYVQGTILLVLRKRIGSGNAKRMDIEGEIEDAVDAQIAAMHNLSHDWTMERLYTDGDMQLAAYASALRVITNYESIDRVQVGADVYRKLKKGERTIIRDLIDYAASVANNKLVPDGFPTGMWRDLDKTSRFYVRMLDMEAKGSTKFADYQDFAKTFSVSDYTELMAETKANKAALAGAAALKARNLGASDFGSQPLRRVLFAIFKTMQKGEPREGVSFLRIEYGSEYWTMRSKLIEFARYVSVKTVATRPEESVAADLLSQKLEVDRL